MQYYNLFAEKFKVRDFSLKHTVESAQPLSFYAKYSSETDSLTYQTFTHMINVAFKGDNKEGELIAISSVQNFKDEIVRRFRLNDNMGKIYREISTDKFIKDSIKKYYGMRLTLNDPWETTLCFVISQNNNVKRIRGIVLSMIEKFGHPIKDDNDNVIARSFPTSSDIASASIDELRACGSGFRARYIKSAAEFFSGSAEAQKLAKKDYASLKETLMSIDGIGDKVADCIALMGYGKLEAFPIDTWSKRVLEKVYFKGKKQKIAKLHEFAERRWGRYAGYAQQYLFWNGRQSKYI